MNKINLMNTYVANLAVMNVKLHNLHWNVVGMEFMPIHLKTEELYTDFFTKYDDVAEQIKILGQTPLSTMKEYLETATIKEVPPKAFSAKEVVSIVIEDIKILSDLAKDIRKAADEEDDFSVVAMFEGHVEYYAKELWFLNSMNQ